MILVTGAAGHVGNAAVRELLAHGYSVRVLLRSDLHPQALTGLEVERVAGDVNDSQSLRQALRGVTQVVHAAGVLPTTHQPDSVLEKVNAQGTRQMLDASKAEGIQRFVTIGSVTSYQLPKTGLLTEQAPWATASTHAYYRTKAQAAEMTLQERSLSPVVLLPTGVLGPFDFKGSEYAKQVQTWMRSARVMLPQGGSDTVDVRDIAAGIRLGLERGRSGEAYLLGGEHLTLKDFALQVQQAAGRTPKVNTLPNGLMRGLARSLEGLSRLTGTPPALETYMLDLLLAEFRVSSQKARDELGYAPRPMTATIPDTVQWWKNQSA